MCLRDVCPLAAFTYSKPLRVIIEINFDLIIFFVANLFNSIYSKGENLSEAF